MDPIKNPFSPGAGSPPPELVGRQPILQQAEILLGRARLRKSEKSLLLTGLRGVGKTVLLNEIGRIALLAQYQTISLEAYEDKPLSQILIPHLKKLLFELDRIAGANDKVKRGLAVLKSFITSLKFTAKASEDGITYGLEIEPEKGSADSGDLEVDLPNLFVAVAEAAQDKSTAVALLIDEIQYFSSKELSSLIMAMHRLQQKQLPFVLIGAGLPVLPELAGDAKSYAERLFNFPKVGELTEEETVKALLDPVRAEGVEFELDAMKEIFRLTRGYPYFIQEWGYQSWNQARHSPITLTDVSRATATVSQRLDDNFFRVRFDRLTPQEKFFLRAMAQSGQRPYRTSDVAATMNKTISRLGPLRASLIKVGMIYSPSYGVLDFTVPLFDEFMIRVMPDLELGSRKN